jgi:hypothetical protein
MKVNILKRELTVTHYRYAVDSKHYVSLKAAINDAKKTVMFGGGRMRVDIITTIPTTRRVTRATVINHDWELIETILWIG